MTQESRAPIFKIPTITNDDLAAFHHFAYGKAAPSGSLLALQADARGDLGTEVDNLGYYVDGVKRTLTDEEIAIFRHSEIYKIVRARQVEKENRDAEEPSPEPDGLAEPDGDDDVLESIGAHELTPSIQTRRKTDHVHGTAPAEDQEQETLMRRVEVLDYDDGVDSDSVTLEQKNPAYASTSLGDHPEGRKLWWPTLEPT